MVLPKKARLAELAMASMVAVLAPPKPTEKSKSEGSLALMRPACQMASPSALSAKSLPQWALTS